MSPSASQLGTRHSSSCTKQCTACQLGPSCRPTAMTPNQALLSLHCLAVPSSAHCSLNGQLLHRHPPRQFTCYHSLAGPLFAPVPSEWPAQMLQQCPSRRCAGCTALLPHQVLIALTWNIFGILLHHVWGAAPAFKGAPPQSATELSCVEPFGQLLLLLHPQLCVFPFCTIRPNHNVLGSHLEHPA